MAGYTQKNTDIKKINEKPKFYYIDRYLNNNNISGKNQIITIVDTLIDFNHAMFRDDNINMMLNSFFPNHRKFVYYKFNGENIIK